MNRIDEAFARLRRERRGGFIPFVTAGDPDVETSIEIVVALARAGADVIELGVPFSDPVADGPVIQRASERALAHGTGVAEVLEVVRAARERTQIPIVLFSYFNPLLQYGLERLANDAADAGADGVLVTDLAPEAARAFIEHLRARDLHMILLVAPTTSDARLRIIAERASGFVYAVSRAGVTGARTELSREAEHLVGRVRAATDLPVAVGFGVSSAAHVRDVWAYADAAIVGSAIVREIEDADSDPAARVEAFAHALLGGESRPR